MLGGERGLGGGADLGAEALGLGQVGGVVEALVQLADLRTEQQRRGAELASDAELVEAACDLFEALCVVVAALPQVPPDLYLEGLQRRWRPEGGGSTNEWEEVAARAAALFRMKDTVCSLYAWGLLTRSVASELLEVLQAETSKDNGKGAAAPRVCMVDPVAGTGFHGAVLRAAGAHVALADSVDGGSTQSSGADAQYLAQCSNPGPSPAVPSSSSSTQPVVWQSAERLCVFDRGEEVDAWWREYTEPQDGSRIPVLFLSFPPPPPSTVAEAALKRFRGDWLVFLGEWRGCTATAAFFDELDAAWELRRDLQLPRWPMMDDRAYVLRRRPLQRDAKNSDRSK